MEDFNLPLILIAGFIAGVSPGPATLALAGTSMTRGRQAGLALASGITTGSLIWSVSAALGIGAIMLANVWLFEIVRYAGASYLLYLAFGAARAAWKGQAPKTKSMNGGLRRVYAQGLALHITNPKAVLFFGSLYAIGVPPGSSAVALISVILSLGLVSALVFHGYALLFSTPMATKAYLRLSRWFQATFALGFAAAGLKILTTRFTAS